MTGPIQPMPLPVGYVAAPPPEREAARLAALHESAVLDTTAEPIYDDLTALAAQICGTPIALISLVDADRQWFKSRVGLEVPKTPRELAFCAHAILAPTDLFEVEDASRDPRFAGNPLVTGAPDIRFYAGSPVLSEEGLPLGTLCVIDRAPRQLTDSQRTALRAVGRLASELLRDRRRDVRLAQLQQELEQRIRERTAELAARTAALERSSIAVRAARVAPFSWQLSSDALEASPLISELHGLPPREAPRRMAECLAQVHPDDRAAVDTGFARARALKGPFCLDYRTVSGNGRVRWVRSSGVIQREDGEEAIGAMFDVTLEVEVQQAIEQRTRELERANTELDDFTYVASHDLKEPLRGIHNYARFLAEDYADKLDVGGQHMLAALGQQAGRMQRLIDDLLHIARLGREPMRRLETDLDLLLDEVMDSLAFSVAEKKVAIHREPLGWAQCDRVRVGEVLRNLLTNAIKYNDKPEPTISIGRREQGGVTGYFVRDNGIGIDPAFHARVFAPFKRLHNRDAYGGGSGVGLAIVKRIVEAHEGELTLDSSPGQGSIFTFTLPTPAQP
jgi:signal transduction histidine kinase